MHVPAVVDSCYDSDDVDYGSYDGVDSYDVDDGGEQYVYVVDVEDDTDDALMTIVTTKEIDAIDACCC